MDVVITSHKSTVMQKITKNFNCCHVTFIVKQMQHVINCKRRPMHALRLENTTTGIIIYYIMYILRIKIEVMSYQCNSTKKDKKKI